MEFGINTLLIILGPTASGKTDLAIKVAKWLDTEIISADSRQFYRELSIGTAKPNAEQLAEVEHHFIGHISISEDYNISRFEQDVIRLLDKLFETHRAVVMTGGSGLYIDAVCNGIDEQPEHDPAIRHLLKEEYKARGINYLQKELFSLDPLYYKEVDLSNPNRLMRALEVCLMTGKPYSTYRKGHRQQRNFRTIKFGIRVPREELVERINRRIDGMMASGLLEEAKANYSCRNLNALNTVGYKEMFEYLDGICTLEDAVEKIRINTRRYAKRQMTWFRKDPEINWIQPESFSPVIFNKSLDR
ncbi:MAG: tRNA (adenosine(37)-N6)-dimethylallyltransferase MiaA [Bacteroidales bacterium]|nr:tRNA (adenosine(37)-N6)-dimethylallyltransferase MiaA [Bacteroidales bacterium]